MNKELQKVITNWDYDESVSNIKDLVGQFKKCSLGIVKELYIAREKLTNQGFRSDKVINSTSSQMGLSLQINHSFADYLEEIGLSKQTAYRWLSLYSPSEDKLYSVEEMKLKISDLFEEVYEIRKSNPKYTPAAGWDNKQEMAYQKWEERTHPIFLTEELVQKESIEFDREYLNILSKTMDNPTPDDIMRQMELCQKYKEVATKEAPVQDQMHIVRYIEKALEMFDEDKRDDIALSIAKVLQLEVISKEGE
ncbi:MAG: hypothetical protein ACPKOI_00620 [Pleomorphochaeta sp.]